MTILMPDAVKSQGNISVTVVQTVADMAAPKLATEINATTSVNISCFVFSGGAGTSTTNKVEAPRRLCATDTFQEFGNTTHEVSDLQYVYSPQAANNTDANKAKAALTQGSIVYLIVRKGLDADVAPYAASQVVEVWRVKLGPQNRTMTGDGEGDQFSITQTVTVTRAPVLDAVIAA